MHLYSCQRHFPSATPVPVYMYELAEYVCCSPEGGLVVAVTATIDVYPDI